MSPATSTIYSSLHPLRGWHRRMMGITGTPHLQPFLTLFFSPSFAPGLFIRGGSFLFGTISYPK
ncbi:hypothetical protein IQ07DRAFT_224700 [Pyrenochaeta sp. DS3sAY3a]|nr:hypothetical protein IQ07DRAFT_224700 [Pyrenochaeta sp. DS3sAY3a]